MKLDWSIRAVAGQIESEGNIEDVQRLARIYCLFIVTIWESLFMYQAARPPHVGIRYKKISEHHYS